MVPFRAYPGYSQQPLCSSSPTGPANDDGDMAIGKLSVVWPVSLSLSLIGIGYFLLGLISALVFRAARDTLRHDLASQETMVRASLTALAIADVSHALFSIYIV